MHAFRVVGALLIAVLAISVAGCGKVTDSLRPKPTIVTIDAKVASVEATTSGAPLAVGRPESLPLWPGSQVSASAEATTPQGKSWTATLVTADGFEAVVKGFAVGLKDAGWTAEVADASLDAEKTSLISATGSSADALFTVVRSADSSLTSINVVVTPK